MNELPGGFDAHQLRGLLAYHQISRLRFAQVCGLNHVYICRILIGSVAPGELARYKIAHGLTQLGLSLENAGDLPSPLSPVIEE